MKSFSTRPKSQDKFPAVVLLKRRNVFWNHASADFPDLQFIGQNLVDSCVTQIQLFPDHSDHQLTISTHKILKFGDRFISLCIWSLPLWDSFSFESRSSGNPLNHLKILALEKVLSAWAYWSFAKVSITVYPSPKQKLPLFEIIHSFSERTRKKPFHAKIHYQPPTGSTEFKL